MKELDEVVKIIPDIQLIAEIQKEYTLKEQLKVKRGLILFAVNLYKVEAEPVEITKELHIDEFGRKYFKNKSNYDPTKIYIYAINKFNALRKVQRDYDNFIKRMKEKESNIAN